jgi:guanylate kinase
VRSYFGEDVVLPIMIECADGVRLQRALDREKAQKQPKYEEMCRRFLADAEDFSEQHQKEAGITQVFNNEDLNNCLDKIKNYMLQFTH